MNCFTAPPTATVLIALSTFAGSAHAVTFTKLLDTSTDYAGIGMFSSFSNVAFDGVNVAVIGQTAAGKGIYQWNVGGLSTIANADTYAPGLIDATFTDFYTLDLDSGNIAFLASSSTGTMHYQGAYTTLGGSLRRVADTTTNVPDYNKPFTHFYNGFDIAIDGQDIVFSALSAQIPRQDGVYAQTGDGPLTRVTQNTTSYSHADVDISNGQITYYIGFGFNNNSNSFYTVDLVTPDDRTLLLNPSKILPGLTNPLHVNRDDQFTIDHGDIAFRVQDKNFVPALFLRYANGYTTTVADTKTVYNGDKLYRIGPTISLNNGAIAFDGTPLGLGGHSTLFLGTAAELRPVIAERARLEGKTVSDWALSSSSFRGDSVVFTVTFSDQTQAVYLATLERPLARQYNAVVDGTIERIGSHYTITEDAQTVAVQQIPYLNRDKRAVMEFALDALPEHAVITSARLLVKTTSSSGNGPTVIVAVYAGDGQITEDDAFREAVVAATRPHFQLGSSGIDLDPQAIQRVLYQTGYLGLLAFTADDGDTDGVGWAANEVWSTLQPPLFEFEYILMPAPLTGDANNDGIVDAADFLAVEQNFGAAGAVNGLLPGDANDDGRVDGADYLFVERHFGATLDAGLATPEPATGAIALLLLTMVMRRRARA